MILPFLKHSDSWAEKNLLGNWEIQPGLYLPVAGIATVQSGTDVNGNGDSAGDRTVINPAGIKGTGTGSSPLFNAAGDQVAYLADDPSAYYVAVGKYAQANDRRNTLAMPHTNNFDLSVVKRINITETQNVEFQAQFLNFFNHAQNLPGDISDVSLSASRHVAMCSAY